MNDIKNVIEEMWGVVASRGPIRYSTLTDWADRLSHWAPNVPTTDQEAAAVLSKVGEVPTKSAAEFTIELLVEAGYLAPDLADKAKAIAIAAAPKLAGRSDD